MSLCVSSEWVVTSCYYLVFLPTSGDQVKSTFRNIFAKTIYSMFSVNISLTCFV